MENQTKEYGQMDFTLPHDIVPLPTQGKFYKNKKQSVKVGYLTAQDENIILGGGDFYLTLLRNKIYEPDVKIEDLLEGDIEAIMIFLRNTAFGPEIQLNLTDPITRKPFQASVMLDQLPIKQGADPNADGTFSVTLPKTNVNVKIRPLPFGQVLELNKIIESYPQGRVAPKVTMKLQKQIVSIDEKTDLAYISKFVEQMPISDSKFLQKFIEENEPSLDLRKVVTSPSGEKLTVNVGFGADFFRPFF